MSKIENNPANGQYLDDWDKFVKEHMTPEEINEMDFRAAIVGELIEARDAGKITVKELEEIEMCEEIELWFDAVFQVLFSHGKTLAIVPFDPNNAS